jgi:hypothetical protein
MVRDHEREMVRRGEPADPGEREPTERGSGAVGFMGGLILGALIGAGIALLVAPERGDVTRRRIRRRLRDLTGDARERLDDLRVGAERELSRRGRHLRRRLRSPE